MLVKALSMYNATIAGGGAPDRQQHSIDSSLPPLVVGVFICLSSVVLVNDEAAIAVLLQQVRIMHAMQQL